MYINYIQNYYRHHFRTEKCIEESLANRYIYGRYESIKIKRDTLKDLFSKQPDGYSHYFKYKGQNFHKGENELLHIILNHGRTTLPSIFGDLSLDFLFKRLNHLSEFKGYHIPVYLVLSRNKRIIRVKGMKMY